MTTWFESFYDDIDHGRLDALAAQCAPDIEFRMAASPAVHGRDAVIAGQREFTTLFRSLSHEFITVLEDGDSVALEAVVTYTRHDGSAVGVPCCSLLHQTDGLVDSVRVYIDLAPLWAEDRP